MLLQALQQRQIPSLPAPAPAGWPPAPHQPDALALLRAILGNPHLHQALQPSTGGIAPTMQLPIPAARAPRQLRRMPLPLRDVMSAIIALAGESISELSGAEQEQEPEVAEYLIGEDGGFVVDPTDPDDRAALVALLFQLNGAAERSGVYRYGAPELAESDGESGDETANEWSESDAWA